MGGGSQHSVPAETFEDRVGRIMTDQMKEHRKKKREERRVLQRRKQIKLRKRFKKCLALFDNELPVEELAVGELAETGNLLYLEQDYESSFDLFTKAIVTFESNFFGNMPRDF